MHMHVLPLVMTIQSVVEFFQGAVGFLLLERPLHLSEHIGAPMESMILLEKGTSSTYIFFFSSHLIISLSLLLFITEDGKSNLLFFLPLKGKP